MSYDLHITRDPERRDAPRETITLDDWLAYIESDADMRYDGFAEAPLDDGSILRTEDESIAVWTGYSQHEQDGNMAWFRHFEDCISVSNPDREIRRKMFAIATALSASVVGDDGELYDANGEPLPDEEPPEADQENARKPWWRFW